MTGSNLRRIQERDAFKRHARLAIASLEAVVTDLDALKTSLDDLARYDQDARISSRNIELTAALNDLMSAALITRFQANQAKADLDFAKDRNWAVKR